MTISSFLILGSAAGCSQPAVTGPDSQTQEGNGVKSHGALRVDGASLCDENGNPVVLRGMSSHGISWYPRYLNGGAMKTLKEYGANLFRIGRLHGAFRGILGESRPNPGLFVYGSGERSG